jgi:hypothetical protein
MGTAGAGSVAVVVLTFRPPAGALEACVDSVLRSGDAAAVYVVDNGRSLPAPPGGSTVGLLTPPRNLGYAGGMNLGLRHATSHGAAAVALLNDDTTVEPGWLAPLWHTLAAGAGERVGAVQPKLLLAGTDPAQLNSVGVRWRGDGAGIDIGYGEVDRGQYPPGPAQLFTGGAVLLSTAFVDDTGAFDERYFMYYEDTDLSWRGRLAGWRYEYVPDSVVRHDHAASSKEGSPMFAHFVERNRFLTLARNAPWSMFADASYVYLRDTLVIFNRDVARRLAHRERPAPGLVLRRLRAYAAFVKLLPGTLGARRQQHAEARERAQIVDRWAVPQ